MVDNVWANRPFEFFKNAKEICVVGIVSPWNENFSLKIVGTDKIEDATAAVICEDEIGWSTLVRTLKSDNLSTPTICFFRDKKNGDCSVIDSLFDYVNAHCFIFTCESVQMNVVSLRLACQNLNELNSDILQIILARDVSAGFIFSFGDYYRFKSYMPNVDAMNINLPQTITNLLIGRKLARYVLENIFKLPVIKMWQQIFLVRMLAEIEIPKSSALVAGYFCHYEHAEYKAPVLPTSNTVDLETQINFLAETAKLVQQTAGNEGKILRAVYALHVANCLQGLPRTLVNEMANNITFKVDCSEKFGMYLATSQEVICERHSKLHFFSMLLDQLGISGLINMDISFEKVEKIIIQNVFNAAIEGHFDLVIEELQPILIKTAKSYAENASTWVSEPDALSLLVFNLKHSHDECIRSNNMTPLITDIESCEAALKSNLARDKRNLNRISQLESELSKIRLLVPGKISMVVLNVLRIIFEKIIILPLRILEQPLNSIFYRGLLSKWPRDDKKEMSSHETNHQEYFTQSIRGTIKELFVIPWQVFWLVLMTLISNLRNKFKHAFKED